MTLVATDANLADLAWGAARPPRPSYPAEVQPPELAGEAWSSKTARLREQMELRDADAAVLTALDDVAWLLNLRGRDVPFFPVLRAFAVAERRGALRIYADARQIGDDVRRHLRVRGCHGGDSCVSLRPYDALLSDLRDDAQRWRRVLLAGTSHAVATAVPEGKRVLDAAPVRAMKAEKNAAEARGMRDAHVRDAAALCAFAAYLEDSLADDADAWNELLVADTVDSFRGEQRRSRGPSFGTIAAFGAHAALPHYRPDNVTSTRLHLGADAVLMLDSGGQYEGESPPLRGRRPRGRALTRECVADGTTDVTRTFHLGTPTPFQKEVYTRVLVASVQLAMLVFPETLRTSEVEVLTRGPLWEAGLDYDHGSGHGIGAFLAVHEGLSVSSSDLHKGAAPALTSLSLFAAPVTLGKRNSNETFRPGYFFTDGEFHAIKFDNILSHFLSEKFGLPV